MAAGRQRESHGVEQTKKMVPFITREPTLGHHVRESVFGVNTCDLDLGSNRILSDNKSNATPWFLDPCLTVGLLPLMIILITASGVFEKN